MSTTSRKNGLLLSTRMVAPLLLLGSLVQPAFAESADSIEGRLDRLSSAGAVSETVPQPVGAADNASSPAGKKEGRAPANSEPRKLSIEERLSRLEAAAAASAANVPAPAPVANAAASGPKVEFNNLRPVIKSADGRNELAVRAMAQFDVASYDQDRSDQGASVPADQRDLGSGALFRRLRIGVEGKFFQDFLYELRFEFGTTDAEPAGTVDIARVGYVGIPDLRVQVGVMQPIVTLADPTASSELTLLERPAVVSTMLPVFGGESARRAIEATFQKTDVFGKGDNLLVSAAFTGQKVGTAHSGSSLDDEGTQVLGRVAYRFYSDDEANLQVGASAAEVVSLAGVAPGDPRNLRFRERPEARVSGERLIDTDSIPAEGASMWGLEAAGNFRNFYIGAEWYEFGVDRDRDCGVCNALAGDPEFSGWYVEGTWVLTGESRRYMASATSNGIGVWAGPKPKNAVGEGDGLGAFEAMARYSTVDLNWNEGVPGFAAPTGGIRGGEQSIFALGLNWYLNANLRIMTDYQWVDVDRLSSGGGDAGQDFQVLQSRAQFTF